MPMTHGADQPDDAGDQGGVDRQPQRVRGLVAGGLAAAISHRLVTRCRRSPTSTATGKATTR